MTTYSSSAPREFLRREGIQGGKRPLLFLPSCLPYSSSALLHVAGAMAPFPGPGLGDSRSGNVYQTASVHGLRRVRDRSLFASASSKRCALGSHLSFLPVCSAITPRWQT